MQSTSTLATAGDFAEGLLRGSVNATGEQYRHIAGGNKIRACLDPASAPSYTLHRPSLTGLSGSSDDHKNSETGRNDLLERMAGTPGEEEDAIELLKVDHKALPQIATLEHGTCKPWVQHWRFASKSSSGTLNAY